MKSTSLNLAREVTLYTCVRSACGHAQLVSGACLKCGRLLPDPAWVQASDLPEHLRDLSAKHSPATSPAASAAPSEPPFPKLAPPDAPAALSERQGLGPLLQECVRQLGLIGVTAESMTPLGPWLLSENQMQTIHAVRYLLESALNDLSPLPPTDSDASRKAAELPVRPQASGGGVEAQTAAAITRGLQNRPREPRSDEYWHGVRAVLAFRLREAPTVPARYPMGSVQADAYYAGVHEGHQVARDRGIPSRTSV